MKQTPINKSDRRKTFTDEKEQEIFDFWLGTGHTEKFLADKYGCNKSVITTILTNGLKRRKKAYNKEYGGDKQAGEEQSNNL